MKHVAIIGGGSWGTALAIALSELGHLVKLWVYEEELIASINENHYNKIYLKDFLIPSNVVAYNSLEECLHSTEIVLTAVPANHCRTIYQAMVPHLSPGMIFVSATKGIESKSLQRMSQIMEDLISPIFRPRIAVISGPSFAKEVAQGDPTAIVIAGPDQEINELIQSEFSGSTLRLYTNNDIVGVELGGAVKNVIAIAAGVCAGLGFGYNSLAAVVTRGLAEMTRLVIACGGNRQTMAGLAGMGDLVLTCHGGLSRNRSVGFQLGQGRKLADITVGMRTVAEGIPTTEATLGLAKRYQIEMPITEQMNMLLHHNKNASDVIKDLMERRLKNE